MVLERIHSSEDVKRLSSKELSVLAQELRARIIDSVSRNGGHLASNLGVVELTIALHRAFDFPKDALIFDVGHQCYAHKLLTGRADSFDTLRQFGGLAGFPRREESPYDAFDTGHASTAISAAAGMARARDLVGGSQSVVAVVGDGALTGGMCYEALSDAGSSKLRMIVVLNDNGMSISRNVGAVSCAVFPWLATACMPSSSVSKTPCAISLCRIDCLIRWAFTILARWMGATSQGWSDCFAARGSWMNRC